MFEKIMNNIATFKQLIETFKQLRIKNLSIKMPFSLAENVGECTRAKLGNLEMSFKSVVKMAALISSRPARDYLVL